MSFNRAFSWESFQRILGKLYVPPDRVNGPTNSQSHLRLFGKYREEDVRVVLFRDHHAWCPYCQKIWLFLEEKRIPYRVQKITMFCYGQKEHWYTKHVAPRGMLPAVMLIDDPGVPPGRQKRRVVTESDTILGELEQMYGPLGPKSMFDDEVMRNRQLERHLFRAWCEWLCRPARSGKAEGEAMLQFQQVARSLEDRLQEHGGPFFLGAEISISDVILTPYVERMSASLFYYKDYNLRKEHPVLGRWFDAMERREVYQGTQSDFSTHAHDLPPQMGGCYFRFGAASTEGSRLVDQGPFLSAEPGAQIPEVNPESRPYPPGDAELEALARVCRHFPGTERVNPVRAPGIVDLAMRVALTEMLFSAAGGSARLRDCLAAEEPGAEGLPGGLPPQSDTALCYVRDRISVPRDMSIWAAKVFRQALSNAAQSCGSAQAGPPLALKHRNDQDPTAFVGDTQRVPAMFR